MNIYKVENLGVQFANKDILKNLSFIIEQGVYLTISGPSGSGKSTLLKTLATLQSYDSGKISYLGKELKGIDPINYRKEVSYCFQQPVLFGTTVRDNLSFPFEIRNVKFDENKASAALEGVMLDPTFLNKNITELSGGEKQRVALIRNLMFTPKVLLLDEITTGLDTITKHTVHSVIDQLHKEGVTIIEITHDDSEISNAYQVIELKNGEIKYE